MKIALVICNDMHMDIANANNILNHIVQLKGYEVVCDYTIADIVIVVTCAFGPNKMYSMRVIADVRLNAMPDANVIVTGCLVKINSEDLSEIPGINVVPFDELIKSFKTKSLSKQFIPQNKVIISEGCLHRCSYCVYPQLVGIYKSKSMENVLKEVETLYDCESTIYITGAQETSDYGVDLYGQRKFAELMEKIVTNFPNSKYVIGWFHPAGLTDDVMSLIIKHKNIVEIMLHIQHVSPDILAEMNRPKIGDMDYKINFLKSHRPDLIISTEVIVGFPGETDSQFQELVTYLEKGYFTDIGVASYEPVIGTKAAEMPNQIPKEVKNERMKYIANRFEATCYPADENSSESVLDEYIKAHSFLKQLPKNILTAESRQKYGYIAGVDTREKMDILTHFNFVFRKISEARSEFEFSKSQKSIERYTEEARKMFYTIIENGEFKEALKSRAKRLLLK